MLAASLLRAVPGRFQSDPYDGDCGGGHRVEDLGMPDQAVALVGIKDRDRYPYERHHQVRDSDDPHGVLLLLDTVGVG